MKIDQTIVNRMNTTEDGKKAQPIIATGTIRVKEKFTSRELAIIAELKTWNIGTQKTGRETINAINKKVDKDYFTFSTITTEREILNACRYLQAEQIGFTHKVNKAGDLLFTRIDWSDFLALDITLQVKTIDDQRKEEAERKAKNDAKKQAEKLANTRETLANCGYNEAEIESILILQANNIKAIKSA